MYIGTASAARWNARQRQTFDDTSTALRELASNCKLTVWDGAPSWQDLRPFCNKSGKHQHADYYHHGEPGADPRKDCAPDGQIGHKLPYHWDRVLLRCVAFLRSAFCGYETAGKYVETVASVPEDISRFDASIEEFVGQPAIFLKTPVVSIPPRPCDAEEPPTSSPVHRGASAADDSGDEGGDEIGLNEEDEVGSQEPVLVSLRWDKPLPTPKGPAVPLGGPKDA